MHITVRQPKGTRNLVFELYIHDALSFSRTYQGRQATTQRYLNQKVAHILQSLLSHTRADFEEFMSICYAAKAKWGNSFSYTLIDEPEF